MTGPGIGNEAISDKDARARYAREFVAAATVKELQQAMASGRLTSRDIVQAYIERIALYDKQGPALNSVLELNPEALDVEHLLKGPQVSARLSGQGQCGYRRRCTPAQAHWHLPTLTRGKMRSSPDYCGRQEPLYLKTNMTEWANMMTDNMPPGWPPAARFVIPTAPAYTISGSSSGSAAAVAAGFVPVSVGTETWLYSSSPVQLGGRHKAHGWFVEPFGVGPIPTYKTLGSLRHHS